MKMLFDFFSPPVFPDDELKTRSAYYLNAITLASSLVVTLLLITQVMTTSNPSSLSNLIFLGIILTLMVVFFLIKNGRVEIASYLIVLTLWMASTFLAFSGSGTVGNQAARYIVITAFAGLILGYQSALWVAALSISSVAVIAYFEAQGIITRQTEAPLVVFVQAIIPLVLSTVFIYLSISSLQATIKREKEEARDLAKNNKELKELHEALETKVKERTDDLLKATLETQRRAAQFQTIAQIAQQTASERDLDALLSIITEIVGAQFNYNHVAIFLNDDVREFTILSAANSKEGKLMIQRGYKLPIAPTSMAGYVAATGNSRSNLDMLEETYLSGADLPATRSEFVLPLKAGSQIIGALDVQSDRENAFDRIDIEALTALANQTTIAIQNARLFTETQTALAESQLLYGTVIKQTWKSAMQSSPQIGYRYVGVKSVPLQKELDTPEIRSALENDDVAVTQPSKRQTQNALAVPLKLREATIGVLNINFPIETEISEDEIDVILATAQRIALALENASLLEESQRRAKREQTISEMSAKIGAGTEVETILKTAIHELSAHISSAQITIEIESEHE